VRRFLLKAIRAVEEGKEPLHVIRDPATRKVSDLISLGGIVSSGASWRELL
jgi:hypothetical protein